jgi:hypothetical protein
LLGYQKTLDSIAFDSFSQLMELGLEVTWAMIVGGVVIGADLGYGRLFYHLRVFITIRRRSRQAKQNRGTTMTSPRALLTAWNIQAKKQLGQNFLNDPNVARAIVNKAGIGDDDVVLEIGPGLGAITVPAAIAARRVIAVDKDGRIIGLLRTELLAAGIDNVDDPGSGHPAGGPGRRYPVKPDGRWWYWATCPTIFHPRSSFS